jgi:hypothetical protein
MTIPRAAFPITLVLTLAVGGRRREYLAVYRALGRCSNTSVRRQA